jgi:hypothetical protein
MTYALQVTVYYVARVEVVKAVRHIPQLRNPTFKRDGDGQDQFAHQVDAIYPRVLFYIFGNPVIFHPNTNDLERRYLDRNSKERDDVGML